MSAKSKIMKQYMSLARSIKSLSSGQACLSGNETDDDSLTIVNVTICPNDGMYKRGKFEFEIDISDDYPDINPPRIRCLTKIYHPNIDQIDEYSEGDICLNLLDELWTPELTLEDYVQGLLFIFYSPNVEDPLNPAFAGDEDEDKMRFNVRRSMRGKEVEGIDYENVLPDGYESDDGETYENDGKFSSKGKEEISDDEDSEIEDTLEESEISDNHDTPTVANKSDEIATTSNIDEATGQQELIVSPVNKSIFSLASVLTRFLRFFRPSTSPGSIVFLHPKVGSLIVCSVLFFAVRTGLTIFRTPMIPVIR